MKNHVNHLLPLTYLSFILGIFIFFLFATPAYAISSISGSDSATSSVGVALPITDIQIVGNAASTTPVKLVVSNGTLGITDTGGLSSLSGTTGSTITFTATVADANAALATLTYTRGSVGTDTLEVSLVDAGEVFFPENGHLYEYIVSTGDWNAANTAAQLLTRYGATGYLTTITSQEENDFAAARLSGAGWMGASDAAIEGDWRWVTGPENGTQFWSGDGSGSTVGGNYANWAGGEPNDSGNEDCAQFLSGGSGEWNDLPCSGSDLPGFVVEFGAPGDLPTVIARNVSLATVNAPTINTLTPADNATNILGTNNLSIVFSENVTFGTGTVDIYRSSDDQLVESIPVTSAQVTGSGSDTITINPSSNLPDETEFYVQIASTTFENASNIFFLGVEDETTWNFTTGDYTGPAFSSIAAIPERKSAVITWSTNEPASTQVGYGVGSLIDQTTPETNTSPRVMSHSVTLSGLDSCMEYSFRVVGIDDSINANGATSSLQSFRTEGCSSGSSATRVTRRSVVSEEREEPKRESDTSTTVSLRTMWNEEGTSNVVARLLAEPELASSEPKLAIEILQAYLGSLQAGVGSQREIPSEVPVRDLFVGMSGEDVRLLQELLIETRTGAAASELERVSATGYFGEYTRSALGEYQQANEIVPSSGYFGPITRNQMKQSEVAGLWW